MSKLCPKKHRDLWIISGGAMLWCYRCGAIRPNHMAKTGNIKWQEPVGQTAENPAMHKPYPAESWDKK